MCRTQLMNIQHSENLQNSISIVYLELQYFLKNELCHLWIMNFFPFQHIHFTCFLSWLEPLVHRPKKWWFWFFWVLPKFMNTGYLFCLIQQSVNELSPTIYIQTDKWLASTDQVTPVFLWIFTMFSHLLPFITVISPQCSC